MAKILYNLFLFIYNLAAKLISPWTPKAKQWINGRKNWQEKLSSEWAAIKGRQRIDEGQQTTGNESQAPLTPHYSPLTVWMHCASLGEFEQGRPVLESLKQNDPNLKIIISFFPLLVMKSKKNIRVLIWFATYQWIAKPTQNNF